MAAVTGVFEGKLKFLGASTVHERTGISVMSILEIGDHTLQGVRFSQLTENYVQKAFNSRESSTLVVYKNIIIGVKVDGKIHTDFYLAEYKTGAYMFAWIVVMVAMLPFIFITFPLFLAFFFFYQPNEKRKMKRLIEQIA